MKSSKQRTFFHLFYKMIFHKADPLFPSVSVMLCSPFFHFSKQKVFNLYFLQFLKERKTFSFETKTEGFHKIWKQKYAFN